MSSRTLGGTLVLSLSVKAGVSILQLVAVTHKELEPGMSGRSCRACSEHKRSQRIPGAVATPSGEVVRRVSLMSGNRAVRLTTPSPRRDYMGIGFIPTMPTPRF